MAIASDGATIQRNPLVNAIGLCVMFPVMILLKTLDASAHLAKGFSKDAEYLATEMLPLIQGLPDPTAVDLIICDGASDMVRFRHYLSSILTWVWSIWCISHIVNRILSKIGAIEQVAEIIRKGKVIVDTFKSSSHFEHAHFEAKCMEICKKRRALIRYVETRFGLYFVMLHREMQLKNVLIACVTSPEWLNAYPSGKDEKADEVKAIIMDVTFWEDVKKLIEITWPLLQLLRLGDSDTPSLHLVYHRTHIVEERIQLFSTIGTVEYIGEVIEAFKEYKDDLLSPAAKVSCLSGYLNELVLVFLSSDSFSKPLLHRRRLSRT